MPDEKLLERKAEIGEDLTRKGFSRKRVWAMFRFLENIILFEDEEKNRISRERIQLHDKNNVMGIEEFVRQEGFEIGLEEGMEKGEQKAKTAMVRNLLAKTEFSDEKIASLANVTVEFVEVVRKEMN